MLVKRGFDFICSLIGLLLLFPVLLIISIWIKLDSPGSIFFRQIRVGQYGKEFKIYKFRTMVSNAETLGKQITVGEDPRITPSGKFLRKYKLDELPQLINVLKGEMSLVGPRPEVPQYVALYTSEQYQVLNAPPGITDLASIQFHNENQILAQVDDSEEFYIKVIMPQKLELNKKYIDKANLLMDFKIILTTLKKVAF